METPASEFRPLPIGALEESTTNPRRRFDEQAMDDLTRSIREHGVLDPILVRRRPGGRWEVVSGARRLRAAKRAELAEIPAQIRELTDNQVLEVQLIENLQREDVHPLEEATGYQLLIRNAGYDVGAIAAKVGKSESYVHQRLRLTALCEEAQKLFIGGRIMVGHALLIARLQRHDQERVLREAFVGQDDGPPYSVRELSAWIQQEIHLDLGRAPFATDDAALVAAAGSCVACPRRTGFEPLLFADIADKDVCTDPTCFQAKVRAHIERERAALAAEGKRPVELSTDWGGSRNGRADAPLNGDRWKPIESKKDRCASATKGLVVAGHRDVGKVLDVCTDPKCSKHAKANPALDRQTDRARADERARKRKADIERMTRDWIFEAVLARTRELPSRKELELVAIAFYGEISAEHRKAIADRRGWEAKKNSYGFATYDDRVAAAHVPGLAADDLARFLVELTVAGELVVSPYASAPAMDRLLALAKRRRVDVERIRRDAAAAVAEKEKVRRAREKRRAEKSGGAAEDPVELDEPACEICGCTEEAACEGGCSWEPVFAQEGRFVCTTAGCVVEAAASLDATKKVAPRPAEASA